MICFSSLFAHKTLAKPHGISAAVVASALVGVCLVSGCKPKGQESIPQQTAQVTQPSVETAQPAAAPETSEQKTASEADIDTSKQDAAGGGVASIAGGWVNAGGACDSGASVFFNPDGTYMSEGERGTWALSGKTLTVTTTSTLDESAPAPQGPDESPGDTAEKSVLTLLSVTDDAARVVLSNGSNANWTRCNS